MKHLVEVDEKALAAAREHFGTTTIKDTVNAALRQSTGQDPSGRDIEAALDVFASMDFDGREQAWR